MSKATRASILIVDDSVESLQVLAMLLQRQQYRVLAATSGEAGLRLAQSDPPPDLILLDVMMPGLDGYAVLACLRADERTREVPVVFLTALSNPEDEGKGLQLGAVDYIAKPINPDVVLARVRTQLEAKLARDWLKNQNATLDAEVQRRMKENDLTQQLSIRALAHLAETRDPETGTHLMRTQEMVKALALRLRHHADFAATLTDNYIKLLHLASPLHDIGKVGVPDHILLKPGRLSDAEMAEMQKHAAFGSMAIEAAEKDIPIKLPVLAMAKDIAHWHHEKWDGSGYPDHKAGNGIPLAARLMAVADVFDAITSRRVYRAGGRMSFDQARQIMTEGRSRHFDPAIIDAFLDGFDEFVAIAQRWADEEARDTVASAVAPTP